MNNEQQTRRGILLALAAYTMWGIAPIYFKALANVPSSEIVANRVVWSFFFLAIILHFTGGLSRLRHVFKDKKRLLLLTFSAVVIGCNWLIYIWSVNNDHMLDASLGYFINPLLNVLLGMVFLGERFRLLQWVAVAFAFLGILIQIIALGSLPWIAIALASSFSCYGLLRKKINIDAGLGLFIETAVLLPVALLYLFFIADSSSSNMINNDITTNLLLIAAGVVTSLPLLCFTSAATKLRLSTLGFFQYIGPSFTFLLAVFLYNEPLTRDKVTAFAFIWIALGIFIFDAIRQRRKQA